MERQPLINSRPDDDAESPHRSEPHVATKSNTWTIWRGLLYSIILLAGIVFFVGSFLLGFDLLVIGAVQKEALPLALPLTILYVSVMGASFFGIYRILVDYYRITLWGLGMVLLVTLWIVLSVPLLFLAYTVASFHR